MVVLAQGLKEQQTGQGRNLSWIEYLHGGSDVEVVHVHVSDVDTVHVHVHVHVGTGDCSLGIFGCSSTCILITVTTGN